jgi:DNA-binding protein HU-beta
LPAVYTSKNTMNKADLVSKIAEDAGLTKVQATAAIVSFIDGVTKTLRSGKRITLVGFGTFSVSKRAARKGRTGETIKIKAKKVAKFKAGKELSARL